MWIIPKNLPSSVSAPATAALISELPELSEACAQSLMWRSTHSPARTWSQRWKRNSWMHHLSGRILKPSHQKSFTDAWTSSLQDSLVNRSASQDCEQVQKTTDTYGQSSNGQLMLFDLVQCSLKTCPVSSQPKRSNIDRTLWDTLPRWMKKRNNSEHLMHGIYADTHSVYTGDFSSMQGCPFYSMSSADWKAWVTKQRQDCLHRLNAARHTKDSEYLSSAFPTPAARDSKGANSLPFSERDGGKKGEQLANFIAHFPTPTVPGSHCTGTMQEWGGSNNGQRVQDHTNTTGNQDEQSTDLWPTATECGNHNRKGLSPASGDGLSTAVKNGGTPRVTTNGGHPTNKTGRGSSIEDQESNWQTPATDSFRSGGGDRKNEMGLDQQAKQWPTPRTITGGAESAERKKELGRENSGGGDLQAEAKGPLNPSWVCTLMNIAVKWVRP